jgi:hypothetical protein
MHQLTLIRMAGGVYDSRNFEERQIKMAWIKNIFYPGSISHNKYYNYILFKVFIYIKM